MTRPKEKKQNPYKPKRDAKAYTKFILLAVLLMVLFDHFVFQGERPYITKMKEDYYAKQALEQEAIESLLPPKVIYPEDGGEYFEAPATVEELPKKEGATEIEKPQELEPEKQSSFVEEEWSVVKAAPVIKAPKKTTYVKPKFLGERAKIAIVIDDVGMNLRQSHAAINLPSEVTLAFLPYAETVRALAKKSKNQGHEIIIHTPMEAMSSDISLGSMALRSNMDYAAFNKEFRKITDSFDGYVGINNHMGSKLTQDPEAMSYLMDELKRRGLYFFDSKTIHTSIAAETAKTYGIPHAERDVFLDHEETAEFTAKALKKLEKIARDQGSAIAIGHPKAITMEALRAWIPTLEARGFELVSLSELLVNPNVEIKVVEKEEVKVLNEITPAAGDSISLPDPASDQWRSLQPE